VNLRCLLHTTQMKKLYLGLLITVIAVPAFCQEKATFKSITERITPHETTIMQLTGMFREVPVDTIVVPSKWRELYFRTIGLGLVGAPTTNANIVSVHLKQTNQRSKEYYFKRNLTVGTLYKKLGKPSYFSYSAERQSALLMYGDKLIYEVYHVTLVSTSPSGHVPFDEAFPVIKKMKVDFLYINLAHEKMSPSKKPAIEKIEQL